MTWAEYLRTWGEEWANRAEVALQDAGPSIRHALEQRGAALDYYKQRVLGYIELLQQAEVELVAYRTLLDQYQGPDKAAWVQSYNTLVGLHRNLSAGVLGGMTNAPEGDAASAVQGRLEVGAVPVVVIGAVAFSIGAVAFAVAFYPYAQSLLEQVRLQRADLAARVEASREGRTLQPPTVPDPNTGPDLKTLAGAGLLLVAAGLTVYAIKS